MLESTAVVVAAPADSDASGRDPAAADPMEAALNAFAESLREGLGRRPDAFVRLVVEARGSARETVAAAAQEAIGGLSSVLHVSTHTGRGRDDGLQRGFDFSGPWPQTGVGEKVFENDLSCIVSFLISVFRFAPQMTSPR